MVYRKRINRLKSMKIIKSAMPFISKSLEQLNLNRKKSLRNFFLLQFILKVSNQGKAYNIF